MFIAFLLSGDSGAPFWAEETRGRVFVAMLTLTRYKGKEEKGRDFTPPEGFRGKSAGIQIHAFTEWILQNINRKAPWASLRAELQDWGIA